MPEVIDYSFGRPAPSSIAAAGYQGVIRYLSPEPAKNLGPAERDELRAAGLSITLNWEDTATNALGGRAQGVSDAQAALAQARALGYPDQCALYFSVDFDVTPAQEPTVADYFRGVESVIGHARTGAYGGFYPLGSLHALGLASWYWQTLAWSGGQVQPFVCLYQNGQQVFGGSADVDEVRGPFGAWEVDSMAIYTIGTDAWPGDNSGNRKVYRYTGRDANGNPIWTVMGSAPQAGVALLPSDGGGAPGLVNAAGDNYEWDGKEWAPIGGKTYLPSSSSQPGPQGPPGPPGPQGPPGPSGPISGPISGTVTIGG